jgi:hypothetical protein
MRPPRGRRRAGFVRFVTSVPEGVRRAIEKFYVAMARPGEAALYHHDKNSNSGDNTSLIHLSSEKVYGLPNFGGKPHMPHTGLDFTFNLGEI